MFREAEELKKRFLDAYWMPDLEYIAMALDPDDRQVRSIGSDAGHCLACGIVERDQAVKIADRLLQPDMFSGWGVRTLSAQHPAFDPYSYHRGTVWPVEHGTFAMGCMRYGLIDQMHRIVRGMLDAAALFDFYRLPEVFSGHQRDEHHPFPALYPKTCWPQAWSASSVFTMVQALLGIYPYAPLNALILDPHLPEWLPDITVDNLHVGNATVRLRFFRDAKGNSDYQVQEKRGKLHIVRQPSPWSVTAGWAERVRDLITSLLPKAS
jgi:glycogen debranching enzyme